MEGTTQEERLWIPMWSRVVVGVAFISSFINLVFGTVMFFDGLKGGWLHEIGLMIGGTYIIVAVITFLFGGFFLKFKKIGWFLAAVVPIVIAILLNIVLLSDLMGLSF